MPVVCGILLLLSLSLLSTATAQPPFSPSLSTTAALNRCNSTCGTNRLPYPFGFSQGCPLRLRCSSDPNNTIFLPSAHLPVRKVTPDSIIVALLANCNRSLNIYRTLLFSSNYAPTRRNALLLRNCSTPSPTQCRIPSTLVKTSFELDTCGAGVSGNVSCYREEGNGRFINYTTVMANHCTSLISSIWALEASSTVDGEVSFDFQTVELGWWLLEDRKPCERCAVAAECMNVLPPPPWNSKSAYRCHCPDGYEGDGYTQGIGCRKACKASKYFLSKCSGVTVLSVVVTGTAVGAPLMVICLFLFCCIQRRCQNSGSKLRKLKWIDSHLTKSTNIPVPIYPYKEIERATNNFSLEHRLGMGAYGMVYSAKLQNELVAIKRIKQVQFEEQGINQVINEVKLLSSVNHPNLVRLLGCSIENAEEQILIYEFMPNGTLLQHIQREKGDGLSWPVRLSIATETARSIAYLHSSINPPIYHRDIKSSNILLDHNYRAKVADFGLSRFGLLETELSHISTAPRGTPGYLDPQYHQSFHLTDKSDVYSFGVVLAEVITGLKVVDFCRPLDEVNLASLAANRIGKGLVREIVDPFLLGDMEDDWTSFSVHKVAELAFRCLAYHRDARPSMVDVAAELEETLRSRSGGGQSMVEADSSAMLLLKGGLTPEMLGEKVTVAGAGHVVEVKHELDPLGLYLTESRASCVNSVDMEEGSHVSSGHELYWSSRESSPSSVSLLANNK